MPAGNQWHSRPIFVSSTFRDMHAERDHLARWVFPELQEEMRQRRHDLVPIDLRWGVETLSLDEQRAKELLVLKVCLDEIDRSRPFFICILGDRYGWIPAEERMRAATREAGFETDVTGKSVTALEIEYGVLARAEQRGRSFFYYRDPLPYDQMDPATVAAYSDAHASFPGAREAYSRLQTLKARIEHELPDRVRHYRASWDADQCRVVGLEPFGRMVLEDLRRELEQETRPFLAVPPLTWQEQERAALETFVHERIHTFVGRETLLHELEVLARSSTVETGHWGACVVGPAGSGKSSLFAALLHRLQARNDMLVLAHSAGTTPRSSVVDLLLRRWTGELAQHLGIEEPVSKAAGSENAQLEERAEAFAVLLSQAAADQRIVLLVDALDQFARTPVARYLTWLPHLWPRNARLIVTTQSGTEADVLARRHGVRRIDLPVLSEEEERGIIQAVCDRYHRTLHPEVASILLRKVRPSGTAAAGNPLWLHLAMEELLLLDEDDFGLLAEYRGTDEEKLHALLVNTAHGFPPDISSLYATLLQRTEEAYGQAWARAFAGLLAICRSGLRELDLRALLPRRTGEPWDPLRFAALRRGYRAHLVQRSAFGQWDWAHAQGRRAVMIRDLHDADERRALHSAVADHLATLSRNDPLRCSEWMYHLIGADDRQRAASHYGTELSSAEEEGATRALSVHILDGVGQEPNPGIVWALHLLDTGQYGDGVVLRLCQRYEDGLLSVLEGDAPLSDQIALIAGVERTLAKMRQRSPEHLEVARALGAAHSILGGLCRRQGAWEDAHAHYERMLSLAETLYGQLPGDAQAVRDLANSTAALGDLGMQAGDLARAQTFYERSLALTEELCRRMPDSAEDARNLEAIRGKLATLHERKGELARALPLAQEALAIAEGLQHLLPDNSVAARDLANREELVGTLLRGQGKLVEAQDMLERVLARRQALYDRTPDNFLSIRDLWRSQAELGFLYQERGDRDHAGRAFEQALALAEETYRRMPDSATAARDVADSCHRLGILLQEEGDHQGARRLLERSLELADELYARAPDRVGAARDLATSYSAIGLLYLAMGEATQAQSAYERALALHEQAHEQAPDDVAALRGMWIALRKLTSVHGAHGDIKEALGLAQRALPLAQDLCQRTPEKPQAVEDLAETHKALGLLYLKSGELARAQESYVRSTALYERRLARDPEDPSIAQELVSALLGTAQVLGTRGRGQESQRYLLRCRTPLVVLERAGMLQHPYLKQLYAQLQRV
jgi:tetratricopeptide (TPR) repeat protein